jgi:hypothetical protein
MQTIITILYTLVAVVGLYMLILRLRKKEPGMMIGIIHGFIGLIGIALLIIVSSYPNSSSAVEPIILLFLAFLLGGGMFSAKVFAGKFNIWLALIHALLAIAGLLFLFRF